VVAAAVVLPLNSRALRRRLAGVRDSKLLTPRARNIHFQHISSLALALGTGTVSPQMIDDIGIVGATRLAMAQAIESLGLEPDYLLADAVELCYGSLCCKHFFKGESKSLSIACASIVAKVTRDNIMVALDNEYPGYGFARHKGYGTRQHREALARLGPAPIHRFSFAPMRMEAF
jgi:ribonuclease HII